MKIIKNTVTVLALVMLSSSLIGCGDSIENSDKRTMSERSHRMSNTNPNIDESKRRENNTDPFIDKSQRRESNTNPFND